MNPDVIAQAGRDLAHAALRISDTDVLEARMRAILAPLSAEEGGAACMAALYALGRTLRYVIGSLPDGMFTRVLGQLPPDADPPPPPEPGLALPQGQCKSCKARIYWVPHHKSGTPAPIDVRPNPQGNIIIEQGHYRIVGPARTDEATPHYTNHFATCPQAGQHRR